MTRSQSGAGRGGAGRRHRYGSLALLVVLFSAFLVARTQAAHAVAGPCLVSDPTCPVGVSDQYTVPFGQKLSVLSASQGILANDRGPAGSKVEFTDGCTDTTSFWSDASFNVKADGTFTYSAAPAPPDFPFSGIDELSYCIIDPATQLDDTSPVVDIAVIPTVRDDSYGTRVNTDLTINAAFPPDSVVPTTGLVANDSGIDSSSLTLDTTSAQGGTIDDNFDGGFTYHPPTGFQGIDTFHYTGQDYDGDFTDGPMHPFDADPTKQTVPMHGTVTIYVDGTAPTVSMLAPPPVTLGTKVTGQWLGVDNVGVANYDTQYQVAPWNGPMGAWTAWRSATTATTGTIAGTYGRSFCMRARARDHAGNLSAFATPRCSAVPLRSTSLKFSSKWVRQDSGAFFGGTAYVTSSQGQNFIMPGVQAKRMWLVATKCSTCGTVQIRWNNVVIAHVNLASPVTVHNSLFQIASFTAPKAGTVRMDVTSPNGKKVFVQGLAVLRA